MLQSVILGMQANDRLKTPTKGKARAAGARRLRREVHRLPRLRQRLPLLRMPEVRRLLHGGLLQPLPDLPEAHYADARHAARRLDAAGVVAVDPETVQPTSVRAAAKVEPLQLGVGEVVVLPLKVGKSAARGDASLEAIYLSVTTMSLDSSCCSSRKVSAFFCSFFVKAAWASFSASWTTIWLNGISMELSSKMILMTRLRSR